MGLWVMNADGSDLKPLLKPDPNTPHFDGCWSPDGKRVAFVLDLVHGTDGALQIDTVNTDGGDEKTVVVAQGIRGIAALVAGRQAHRLGQHPRRQSGYLYD